MPTANFRFRGLNHAIREQNAIGWSKFLEGCISKEWRIVMENYYDGIKSRKSGKRWTIMLIQKLWDVAWDQWEHRNGILHDQEHLLLTQSTDRQIAELYHQAQRIPRFRRPHHFNRTLQEILDKEFSARKIWLNHATNAIERLERSDEMKT